MSRLIGASRSSGMTWAIAPDGPQQCSGLPTARYSIAELAEFLGAGWVAVAEQREEHVTPAGAIQPLTWAAFRRQS